ncbi:threonine synthase, partial [Morganella morganii]|nr:threonine synthase [Morganella morganii]
VGIPFSAQAQMVYLLAIGFGSRSTAILHALIGHVLPDAEFPARVRAAFAFPAPLNPEEPDVTCLELLHGPTLSFKDFGERFIAQALAAVAGDTPVTILT